MLLLELPLVILLTELLERTRFLRMLHGDEINFLFSEAEDLFSLIVCQLSCALRLYLSNLRFNFVIIINTAALITLVSVLKCKYGLTLLLFTS